MADSTSPLVSVIIPVHNRRALVTEAIESALAQSYAHTEVLVVDDGSTDGTADAVAQRFGDQVRLIRLPVNHGRSVARNTGWALARGALVAFLDSDDRWDAEKLASQVPHFADPQVVLVHCRVRLVDADGRPLLEASAAVHQAFDDAERRGYGYDGMTETWCRLYTPAVMVRREALHASGGFDPCLAHFEDWDVFWRIAKAGRVVTVPASLVDVRKHPGNSDTDWTKAAEPWLHVCRKHLAELDTVDHAIRRRARHNLLLNRSLGEYWRGRRWASRWWMWRALLVDRRPLRRPGYFVWGAPLLHAFLPRRVADWLVRKTGVDPYRKTSVDDGRMTP